MAPFYRGYKPTLHLAEDDVAAIQALYGDMPSKKSKKHLHAETSVSPAPTSGNAWPRTNGGGGGGGRATADNSPGGGSSAGGGVGSAKPHPGLMNPGSGGQGHPDPDIYNSVHQGYPIWPDVWDHSMALAPPILPDPGYMANGLPDICALDRLDAITMNTHGETFVFRGKNGVIFSDQFPSQSINQSINIQMSYYTTFNRLIDWLTVWLIDYCKKESSLFSNELPWWFPLFQGNTTGNWQTRKWCPATRVASQRAGADCRPIWTRRCLGRMAKFISSRYERVIWWSKFVVL